MKKLVIVIVSVSLFSCGYNKEEKMLFDYQQENVGSMNFNLKDLNFKIEKIEKVLDITSKDSMQYFKKQYANMWEKDLSEISVDTLTFDYVNNALNEAISMAQKNKDSYKELMNITNDSYKLYDYSKEVEKFTNSEYEFKTLLLNFEKIEKSYNDYAVDPEAILSTKYKAQYSLNNPLLGNTKQNFNKFFYTNKSQTAFILDEDI